MRAPAPEPTHIPSRPVRSSGPASVTALPGRSDEDKDLMRRICDDQDRGALDTLARHYGPRLKSWLMKHGEGSHTAEDIVQDVIVVVWTRAAQFDSTRGSFSTWVYRMVRNRWIDHKRKHDRLQPTSPEIVSELADAPVDAADAHYERAEVSKAIQREMAQLSNDHKQILQLAFFEGLSHSQIAERTGLALGTVKSRIRAPLQKMRAGLESFRGAVE